MWNLKSCGRSISSFEQFFFSSLFSIIGTCSLKERITEACLFNALDVIIKNYDVFVDSTFLRIVAKVEKFVSDEDVTKCIVNSLDVVTCFVVVISSVSDAWVCVRFGRENVLSFYKRGRLLRSFLLNLLSANGYLQACILRMEWAVIVRSPQRPALLLRLPLTG